MAAALRQEMASFAMEVLGSAGAVLDSDEGIDVGAWPQSFLSTPGMRIAGGTDEILRNIVAERVLRLPPDIRQDKDVAFKDIPTGTKAS